MGYVGALIFVLTSEILTYEFKDLINACVRDMVS